jgi:hypothetical protein
LATIKTNKKVSEEATAGALATTDLLRIVQGLGTTPSPYGSFKVSLATLSAYIATLVTGGIDVTKVGIHNVSTAYTYDPTDAGLVVRHTGATAVNATIAPNATKAFALNQVVTVRQVGAGQVTFVYPGVTLNIPTGYVAKTRAAGSVVMLHYVAADTWDVTGDLATS